MYHGILLCNKPRGISSHDAVARVRKCIRQKGVGHTGTLDPLAEGLLILCIGRATKVARYFANMKKTYEAEVCLGIRSETYDAERVDLDAVPLPIPSLTEGDLDRLLEGFLGKSMQKVPAYSAVQVEGKRLYRLARQGEEIEQPEREIEISEIKLVSYSVPHLRMEVTCSSGTYVRSLANDIGDRIGCGGYLASLRRTAVGEYGLQDALTLDEIIRHHESSSLQPHLKPIEGVLQFSAITVNEEFSRRITQGRQLTRGDIARIDGDFAAGDHIVLKDASGVALAVGTAELASKDMVSGRSRQLFSYERVLN
jgi:tRNA pseudouridine55 synthase